MTFYSPNVIIQVRQVIQVARKARIKDDYGIFHIRQTGGEERNLFERDEDRLYFIDILKRTQSNFQFRLYAYCVLSPNEYQLVLDVNGSDLSKIMKSINISYAMYARCDGRLFKDRYKSQMLADRDEMMEKVREIHENASTSSHSEWNSFCLYDTASPLRLDWVTKLDTGEQPAEGYTCIDCLRTLDEAKMRLDAICQKTQQVKSDLLKDKRFRNQLISDFRRQSTLSLKELGELFGGLSESTVSKILKRQG